MPEQETIEKAREDAREGKSPSTQAGEFVREEMEHIREGKHGARSAKQAIAIGLSKARRAGVKLPPPKKGTASRRTRKQAKRDVAKGRGGTKSASRTRSRATKRALNEALLEAAPDSELRPTVPAPRRKPRERGNGLVKRHGITETASCRAKQHQESRQSSEKKTDYLASPQENPHGVG